MAAEQEFVHPITICVQYTLVLYLVKVFISKIESIEEVTNFLYWEAEGTKMTID